MVIELKITGYAPEADVRAVLEVQSSDMRFPKPAPLDKDSRDRFGHFNTTVKVPIAEQSPNQAVLIGGKLTGAKDNVVAWIPLRIYKVGDYSRDRYYAKDVIASVGDRERALNESYPFSRQFGRGFITAENLDDVLLATKRLIEMRVIVGKNWEVVFGSFLQNASFFQRDSKQLPIMLTYLATYGNLTQDQEFYSQYARLLVRLKELDIGGTNIDNNQTLDEYIFQSLTDLISKNTSATLSNFRRIIKAYRDQRSYQECVMLSSRMFKSISQTKSILVDAVAKPDNDVRSYVLSAMQGATECLQLDFADRADNGSKMDKKAAAAFLKAEAKAGAECISSFVQLFDELDNRGNLFPRRPKGFTPEEASRIQEISNYYGVFTADV